jgi:hypothetical protein
VLPCLQSVGRKSIDDPKYQIQGFDTYYYEDIGRLAGFGAANRSTVPELLVSLQPTSCLMSLFITDMLFVLRLSSIDRSVSFDCMHMNLISIIIS